LGRDLEALPVATVEYAIPSSFFGGDKVATMLGTTALDFKASYFEVWSTFHNLNFNQLDCAGAIRVGWRF